MSSRYIRSRSCGTRAKHARRTKEARTALISAPCITSMAAQGWAPTSTMGKKVVKIGRAEGGRYELADHVSSSAGCHPDMRVVCFNVGVRNMSAPPAPEGAAPG